MIRSMHFLVTRFISKSSTLGTTLHSVGTAEEPREILDVNERFPIHRIKYKKRSSSMLELR